MVVAAHVAHALRFLFFFSCHAPRWLGAPVALLRIIHPFSLDQAQQDWFIREAEGWQKLRHPQLASFFGMTVVPSTASVGVVSETLGGQTLDMLLRLPPSTFTWMHVRSVLLDVAAALVFLHNSHLCHGDVRVSNVCAPSWPHMHTPMRRWNNLALATFMIVARLPHL